MTKSSLLAILSLAAVSAHAAPFTGKGLPSGILAFGHFDGEAGANSLIGKALSESFEKEKNAKNSEFKKIADEFGCTGDIKDASFGLIAAGKEPEAMIVAHGSFDPAKFKSIPSRHSTVKAISAGGLTWYDVAEVSQALGKKDAKPGRMFVTVVDARTAVIAGPTARDSTAAAVTGKSASYKAESGAAAALAGSPAFAFFTAPAFAEFMRKSIPADENPGVKSVALTAGETAGNLAIHADTKFIDADKATETHSHLAQLQMVFGMMLTQKKSNETADQKADRTVISSLLKGLKVDAKDDTMTIDLKVPAGLIADRIRAKSDEIAKSIAGAAK